MWESKLSVAVITDSHSEYIVYKKTDAWFNKWQWMKTSGPTSGNEWNKWQWGVQRMTKNNNEWSFQLNFFFRIREKSITKHPEKYPFDQKPCEVPWKRQIQLKLLFSTLIKKCDQPKKWNRYFKLRKTL